MPTNETKRLTRSLPIWSRPVATGAAVLFFLSWIFPVTAGLSKDTDSFSKWWGRLDVGLAFLLVILTFIIMGVAQGKVDKRSEDASYRTYRVLLHGILVMCVVFFLLGDRIVWINCLTGFAWRAWLLLYALPAWFTASGMPDANQSPKVGWDKMKHRIIHTLQKFLLNPPIKLALAVRIDLDD